MNLSLKEKSFVVCDVWEDVLRTRVWSNTTVIPSTHELMHAFTSTRNGYRQRVSDTVKGNRSH